MYAYMWNSSYFRDVRLGFFDGIRHKSPSPRIRAPTNAKNSIRSLRLWTVEKNKLHMAPWWHGTQNPRQNASKTDLPNWGDLKHFFHGDAKTLELDPWPKPFVSRKDPLNQVQGFIHPRSLRLIPSLALGKPTGLTGFNRWQPWWFSWLAWYS